MSSRKYIRIALTTQDEGAFKEAKAQAEQLTGIVMSDSMYALSVIRQSIRAGRAVDRMVSAGRVVPPKK